MSVARKIDSDRYKDRPLLRLLDCYILDAIGQLPAQQEEALKRLEPGLQEAFGSQGGWREIVEEHVGFLPSAAMQMEIVWAGYQEMQKEQGGEIVPAEFVRGFVAQNFPSLVEDDGGNDGAGAPEAS